MVGQKLHELVVSSLLDISQAKTALVETEPPRTDPRMYMTVSYRWLRLHKRV